MAQTSLERNKQVREINYLARDFDSYKTELIEYTKKYFPDDWQDFNEASGGMALLEMIAYIGDNLSFLIDRSVNECFIDRAIEPKNVYSLAKNMGYTPKFRTPSTTNVNISATFSDSSSSTSLFKLLKQSTVRTSITPSVNFQLLEDVDFSSSKNRTSSVPDTGFTTYTISNVPVIAGSSKKFETNIGQSTPFLRIDLPDSNITEITSVSSSDGYEWYKVNNLAENTIFYGEENTDNLTNEDVPYVLKLKKVPRRFIIEKTANNGTSIVFGSGDSSAEDSEIIPNPDDFVLSPSLRGSPSGFAPSLVDSSNFLNTKSMGISPKNVKMTVNYRVGGGLESNVGRGNINSFVTRQISFLDTSLPTTNPTLVNTILNSLTVSNPEQATGGKESESLQSIKRNSVSFFNSQNRCVTLQDYQVRVLSMPGNFGSVYRCNVRKDPSKLNGIELFLCGINSNQNLINVNSVLKNNVERYIKRFKSFSDTIKISDPTIINIGVDFSIVPSSTVTPNEALLDALLLIKDLFRISRTNFGDSIVLSDIAARVQSLKTVQSVDDFKIINKNFNQNVNYSDFVFNVRYNTRNGVLRFPSNALWEVKYPNSDIVGRLA